MPLFFLLSGFSLTVTYGRRVYRPHSSFCCRKSTRGATTATEAHAEVDEAGLSPGATPTLPPFPTKSFLQNRLARVMPVYYVCILISLPPWLLSFGDFPFDLRNFLPCLILSVIPFTTLFSILFGSVVGDIDGPAWTVCTLVVMWLFYPCFLTPAQRKTDQELVKGITRLFYIQYVLIQVLFNGLSPLGYMPAFATARYVNGDPFI